MTIGRTKRRRLFASARISLLNFPRNVLSSFVLWHRKRARKKEPFVPDIAPDTWRFACYIILQIRPRVSAWVLHEAWTRKLKSFPIVHTRFRTPHKQRYNSHFRQRHSSISPSFMALKKGRFIKREFFFSANLRLLPRRYACSSMPRQAVSAKKRSGRQKAVLRSVSHYQTRGFVYGTKNSDARARGKISGRANRNERDVHTHRWVCWMNF